MSARRPLGPYGIIFLLILMMPSYGLSESLAFDRALESAVKYHDKKPKLVLATLSPYLNALQRVAWPQRLCFYMMLIEARSDLGLYTEAMFVIDKVLISTPKNFHSNPDYLRILYKKSYIQIQIRDISNAVITNDRLFRLGTDFDDRVAIVEAYLNRMLFAHYNGNWEIGFLHAQKAYGLVNTGNWNDVPEQKYQDLVSKVKYELARLYRHIRPDEAYQQLLECLEIDTKNGNVFNMMSDLNHLVFISIAQREFALARIHALALEKEAKDSGRKSMLMSAYTSLSEIEIFYGNIDEANRYLGHAELYKGAVYSNNVLSRFMLQRSRVAVRQGRYALAVDILNSGKEVFFRKQEPVLEVEFYGLLASAFAGKGDANAAYLAESQRLQLYRSLQDDRRIKLIQSMTVQFEQELRLLEKKLLDRQSARQSDVDNFSYQIWLLTSMALLFPCLAFLCYKLRRVRKQNSYTG